MKICPKCNTEHNKGGIFCSRKCANSRVFSDESKRKKSIATIEHWKHLTDEQREEKNQIYRELSYKSSKKFAESLLTQDWDVIGVQGRRLRVILEQDGKCNNCGISHWNDKRITLEYEHKDGNNQNNSRENVEALCPNCHSQTTTWRGRNIGKGQQKIERYLNL
jgi:hypothetical protein